jgi:ornithine decarboxylase
MNGWNEQMYEKLPAVANVIVLDSPGWIAPVSKLPELVAVCGWVWALVNVTAAPTATFRSPGSNLKSPMVTLSAAAAAPAPVVGDPAVVDPPDAAVVAAAWVVGEAVAGDAGELVDFESLPHAVIVMAAAAARARDSRRMFTALVRSTGRERMTTMCGSRLTDPTASLTDGPASRFWGTAFLTSPVVPMTATPTTSKLEAFLRASTNLPTPFVVVDVDVVEQRYAQLTEAVPEARVFYAVKANPAMPVLERLVALGSAFDVASPAEIDRVLLAGADPATISYGNTIKKRRDIAYAASVGVRRYTVDAEAELDKLVEVVPGASVCVRLRHECGGADWPLSRKFGCDAAEVTRLLALAAEAGMETGVSFHVGSQQRDLGAWDDTLEVVAGIAARAADLGAAPSFLNLGGGFPGTYREDAPAIAAYGVAVRRALHRWFPGGIGEVMIEPGRYLVADAGVLRSEVVLVSRRSIEDQERWVYLDCGKFHGLAETMDEAIRYRLRTPHDGPGVAVGPVAIAGPTCDSADVLYEKSAYELPLALAEGDFVDVLSAGAYTTTYSSIGFNGFPPLDEHYI